MRTMTYVDGFLLPLPKKNLAAYRTMARKACAIWRDHGALDYHECVGDDFSADFCLPFTKAANVKSGEIVVIAWILYKSRSHRDKVNAAVMKDPRMNKMLGKNQKMPFDCKRMAYGGFKTLVELKKK